MKISEQEFERGGNKKKRIVFSVGFEEVEILYSVLIRAMETFPRTLDEESSHNYSRMKNMSKAMSVYLGKSNPNKVHKADTKCPYCRRFVKGEKALEIHEKDVHPYKVKDEKS